MRLPVSILCGVLFAASAIAAGIVSIAAAPRAAIDRAHTRLTSCALPGLRCAPENVFLHQRAIETPIDPAFGPANADLLFSSAWLDLGSGARTLALPATGDRFFALDVRDANNGVAGRATRGTIGRDGGRFLIAGPDWAGRAPPNTAVIRVATERAWIVARFAVHGESDVAAVRGLQDGLRIARPDE